MTSTYEMIATTTTSGSASTVSFTSIPATYTDLVIIMNFSLSINAEVYIRFNSDSAGNYSRTYIEGNGSSASSARNNNLSQINILGRSTQMINIINFMNYANTTTFKTLLARFSSPSEIVGAEVGMWRNTNAITTIGLSLSAGNFTNGSVITLYGIKAE
jgi:hypothetical protein